MGESDLDEAELLIPPAGRGACSARVLIHSAAACKIRVCIMIVNIDCLSQTCGKCARIVYIIVQTVINGETKLQLSVW